MKLINNLRHLIFVKIKNAPKISLTNQAKSKNNRTFKATEFSKMATFLINRVQMLKWAHLVIHMKKKKNKHKISMNNKIKMVKMMIPTSMAVTTNLKNFRRVINLRPTQVIGEVYKLLQTRTMKQIILTRKKASTNTQSKRPNTSQSANWPNLNESWPTFSYSDWNRRRRSFSKSGSKFWVVRPKLDQKGVFRCAAILRVTLKMLFKTLKITIWG